MSDAFRHDTIVFYFVSKFDRCPKYTVLRSRCCYFAPDKEGEDREVANAGLKDTELSLHRCQKEAGEHIYDQWFSIDWQSCVLYYG